MVFVIKKVVILAQTVVSWFFFGSSCQLQVKSVATAAVAVKKSSFSVPFCHVFLFLSRKKQQTPDDLHFSHTQLSLSSCALLFCTCSPNWR